MKKLLILLVSVFLLTSCSNKASRNEERITNQLAEINKEIERLDKELLSFENQLAEKTKKMVELEELVESLKYSDRESINQLSTLVAMNEKLIKHLPEITRKQGYILQVNEHDMIVDYANWEQKADEPNGGHIVDQEGDHEKVSLHSNVEVYILNGATIGYKPFDEFDPTDHEGLYDLYFVNNKVVLIAEKYIP